jgi:DNA helicase-2/ATP-dependent DNA helicase PcrA
LSRGGRFVYTQPVAERRLDRVVAEELDLLRSVSERLADLPRPDPAPEASIVRDLERLREQLLSRSDSKDAMSLTEQWHRQNALLHQLQRSGAAAIVDPGSPYFAHLRLRENGGERDLCLGRATCLERGLSIVDWRNAPISRIYYRYEQGEEFEEEFAGRSRVGRVVARRGVTIRDGRLRRVEAPEGVFRDGPRGWSRDARETPRLGGGQASAMRAWGPEESAGRRLGTDLAGDRRRADKHLPEITGLIDPEQFGLITRPASGFLAIRGMAGSGKTTVALHRIAYLAFEQPEIDSDRTLFVAFSAALRNYVGHVLPALGVDRVRIVAFRDWVTEQRRRHFPRLPGADRIDTPEPVQRLKLHPALGVALAEHVHGHPGPSIPEQALDDWASVLTRPDWLRQIFEREAPGSASADAIARLVEWSRQRNEELFAWLAGDADVPAELDPEDETLLLRAWQLRVGPLRGAGGRPLRYRHVAIDEVQDFSPLEVQLLLECLDEHRSLTLAGDTQQHVMQASGFTSWAEFLRHLGLQGAQLETLRVSYRSSQPVVDFALSVLGELREDEEPPATTRSGPPVELFRFTDRGACVAFLAQALREVMREEPLASVAVLTPTREHSAAYHEGFGRSDLPNLRRVEQGDFLFTPGIEVTEIEEAKGLEFDYVVLVEVTDTCFPDSPAARRRLHVGATRAVHQLWLTCVGTPAAIVPMPAIES